MMSILYEVLTKARYRPPTCCLVVRSVDLEGQALGPCCREAVVGVDDPVTIDAQVQVQHRPVPVLCVQHPWPGEQSVARPHHTAQTTIGARTWRCKAGRRWWWE